MLEDILRGLENCQTILAFKDENLSKEFFNLTNSDKKSDLVLFDKDYIYSYSGQENVGLFAIIYTFKDRKQDKEINLFVRRYGNVIVISSNTYDDNIVKNITRAVSYYKALNKGGTMIIRVTYNYAHAMTVLQEWLKDNIQGNNEHAYTLINKNYFVGLLDIKYLFKGNNQLTFFVKKEDEINVFAKTAILTLVNKDLENDEVEIAFNIETSYELEYVNHILNLLSTDIMNMSDAW